MTVSNLILREAHLNDPCGIERFMVRVFLVLLPAQEVRGILPVGVTRGHVRQHRHLPDSTFVG